MPRTVSLQLEKGEGIALMEEVEDLQSRAKKYGKRQISKERLSEGQVMAESQCSHSHRHRKKGRYENLTLVVPI